MRAAVYEHDCVLWKPAQESQSAGSLAGSAQTLLTTVTQARYLTRPAVVLVVAALSVAVAYSIGVGWFASHRLRLIPHVRPCLLAVVPMQHMVLARFSSTHFWR